MKGGLSWRLLVAAVLFSAWLPVMESAALAASKIIEGQAVLGQGATAARQEAIRAAFAEALRRYIYDDLGFSREYAAVVNEKILRHPRPFIRSYTIQQEQRFGDLYQVELKIDLQDALLGRELERIETGSRPEIVGVALMVLSLPAVREKKATAPAAALSGDSAALSSVTPPLSALDVEFPKALAGELEVYGFKSTVIAPSPGSFGRLERLLEEGDSPAETGWLPRFPGRVMILVRPFPVEVKGLSSLRKALWKQSVALFLIDRYFPRITRLGKVEAKIIESDRNAALAALRWRLTAEVVRRCSARLARDYRLPRENESSLLLSCRGFRSPADFSLFRERLARLRTVKKLELAGLSRGTITLCLELLISPATLIRWLEHCDFGTAGFRLRIFSRAALPGTGTGRRHLADAASVTTDSRPEENSLPLPALEEEEDSSVPLRKLVVQVEYAVKSGN